MIKAKGSIIRTYNMSYASSNAGIIAISGSKGYRYMGSHAYNLIHFGKFTSTSTSPYELEQSHTNMKYDIREYKDLYLKNTNLSEEEIDSYFNHEGSGKLYAKDCLAKGLCDYVITPRGWTNNVEDLIKQNIR
jgi:ATP-dependent protease ClpP protease subunit